MTELVHKNHVSPKIRWEVYGTLIAMFLFTLLEFGIKGVELPVILVLGISSVNYFLILILYAGIAMLAYKGRTRLLWGSGLAVFIVGLMFTGTDFVWTMFSQWSMILFGGAVIGRLTMKNEAVQKVYTFGMLAVLLFALTMYLPLLSIIAEEFTKASATMIENAAISLPAAGYSAEETATLITGVNKSLSFTGRIIPSLLLLSSVLQYTLGYFIFVYILSRRENSVSKIAPFSMWKMPYYLTIILLAGACFRFFGGESVSLMGDNVLVFLAFFYSISGLALMEYYLKKLKFPPFVKVSFYILLFITQLVGFFVAVFAGFIDSFKDFRNSEQLNLQNE